MYPSDPGIFDREKRELTGFRNNRDESNGVSFGLISVTEVTLFLLSLSNFTVGRVPIDIKLFPNKKSEFTVVTIKSVREFLSHCKTSMDPLEILERIHRCVS